MDATAGAVSGRKARRWLIVGGVALQSGTMRNTIIPLIHSGLYAAASKKWMPIMTKVISAKNTRRTDEID